MAMNAFKSRESYEYFTIQMDGFVICKSGLIMTHWYSMYSQAYPMILAHAALDIDERMACPLCGMIKSVNTRHFYFTLEVQCRKSMLLLSYNKM